MNVKTKEIYSELFGVLILLGDEYINKLPNDLINLIIEKRDISYNPQYVDDIPLNKQNIKKETISLIALLHLNYWCEGAEEKNQIEYLLKKNEEEYQNKLRDKYNPDNLFKRYKEEKNRIQDNVEVVVYKESLFKKIINKIKQRFSR